MLLSLCFRFIPHTVRRWGRLLDAETPEQLPAQRRHVGREFFSGWSLFDQPERLLQPRIQQIHEVQDHGLRHHRQAQSAFVQFAVMTDDQVLQYCLDLDGEVWLFCRVAFQDLQAERDVLHELTPRRVAKAHAGDLERLDFAEVVEDRTRDQPIKLQPRKLARQNGG